MSHRKLRLGVVENANNFINKKYYPSKDAALDFSKQYSCVHLLIDLLKTLGNEYPRADLLYKEALRNKSFYPREDPFDKIISRFFEKRTDEYRYNGDIVYIVYKNYKYAHFGVYVGNGLYIDTYPDRGYVAFNTLENMMSRDGTVDYIHFDIMKQVR